MGVERGDAMRAPRLDACPLLVLVFVCWLGSGFDGINCISCCGESIKTCFVAREKAIVDGYILIVAVDTATPLWV